MSPNDSIDLLMAKSEIHDALLRYCRGVDRGDYDLAMTAYHPGATDWHGRLRGDAAKVTRAIVSSMDAVGGVGQHHITNSLVDVSGEQARAETYFVAFHPHPDTTDQPVLSFSGGRYLDRFERRNGRWAIAERTVVFDWSRELLQGDEWNFTAAFARGLRGAEDPSHNWFRHDDTEDEHA